MATKIALFLCGNLSGEAYAQNGNYTSIYGRYLQATVPESIQYTLDTYDVVHEMAYPSEDREDSYNCIMLTGSAASAYENIEWINKLVDYLARIAATKPHIKLIGICFGHQIIARALGGECVPNGGKWEVGPTTIQLTDLGKQLFHADTLTVQEMHRDHVPTVPPKFQLLASTSLSPNQGMVRYSETSPSAIQIATVQGHPEFTEPIVTSIINQRAASGVIDAEALQTAEERRFVNTQDDAVNKFGKFFWDIILGKL
ncbi:class I glutamine amidotransferase-like protein [Agrocybe pediades]|nr:class I glutamine amidotransferase-like protein [Agrocybe pediades]